MSVNVDQLLQDFVTNQATDLYLTVGAPPTFRFGIDIKPCPLAALTEVDVREILQFLVSREIIEEFDSTLEYNTAINWKDKARFRINILRQQQHTAVVMRRIRTEIPSLESLSLPKIYADLIMEKRGLILVVGPTGSGKSTSLAAMLGHRNMHSSGHIVTIEDPVEFLHTHNHCIITQRDVGIDTYSFSIGLKNMLRQTPDIIVIGEIRDRETMEHAIVFAETGHLCLATLHANNSNQAIERVLNFFPEEKHAQVLLNLSFNLKAILSQRLVRNVHNERSIAIEILLNQGLIRNLIHEGHVREIKECIEKGRDVGMQTFDQALFDLYTQDAITEEVAIAESDNPANLRLVIKQRQLGKQVGPLRTTMVTSGLVSKQQF
jgi:twitching motility protein PilU